VVSEVVVSVCAEVSGAFVSTRNVSVNTAGAVEVVVIVVEDDADVVVEANVVAVVVVTALLVVVAGTVISVTLDFASATVRRLLVLIISVVMIALQRIRIAAALNMNTVSFLDCLFDFFIAFSSGISFFWIVDSFFN
jgi:hypothetical protein